MQDMSIGGVPSKILTSAVGPGLDAELELDLDLEEAQEAQVGPTLDEVQVRAQPLAPPPPPKRVDVGGALGQVVAQALPGATVAFLEAPSRAGGGGMGAATQVEAINTLVAAVDRLPPALKQAVRGMEVYFAPSMWRHWTGDASGARAKKKLEEDSEVELQLLNARMLAQLEKGRAAVDPQHRRMVIPVELLSLPEGPEGQNQAQQAILEGLLRVAGGASGATGRFAEATGWQQSVVGPQGEVLMALAPADGREAGTLAAAQLEAAGGHGAPEPATPDASPGALRLPGAPTVRSPGQLAPGQVGPGPLPTERPADRPGTGPLGRGPGRPATGPLRPLEGQGRGALEGPTQGGRPGTGALRGQEGSRPGTGSLGRPGLGRPEVGGRPGTGALGRPPEGGEGLGRGPLGRGPGGESPGPGPRAEGGTRGQAPGRPGPEGPGPRRGGPGQGAIEALQIPTSPPGPGRGASEGPGGPSQGGLEEGSPIPTGQGVQVPVMRGGQVVAVVQYQADPLGGSLEGGRGLDPGSDFSQAMAGFLANPGLTMRQDPMRFLVLNAEARKLGPTEVARLAGELGVDLGSALGELVASGRLAPKELDRLVRANGVKPDLGRLEAADAKALAKAGTTLAGLVERLSLDLSVRGVGTGAQVERAKALAGEHLALAGGAKLQRELGAFGLVGRISSWLVTQAPPEAKGPALGRATMAAFQALPLAAQLRADPALALGAAWVTLSAAERAQLKSPEGLKALMGAAAAKSDQLSYVPQTLTPNEQRALALKTVLSALVEGGGPGEALRKALAGEPLAPGKPPADPKLILEGLKAKNGQPVWALLPEAERAALLSPEGRKALKASLASPEWVEARQMLAQGGLGAEGLRTRLLKEVLKPAGAQEGLAGAIARLQGAAVSERKAFVAEGGPPLELAMAALRRQVTDGPPQFARQLASARTEGEVASLVGPWVWGALKDEEKKALMDADVRRMVVEESQAFRASGKSLAEAARSFQEGSQKLQAALDLLLQPDQQFRIEFAKDPVAALQRRNLWKFMPEPLQAAMEDPAKRPGLQAVTEAVQQVVVPMLAKKDAEAVRRQNNLKRAITGVNVGNYRPLLGLLRLGQADLGRHVRAGLMRAMEEDEKPVKGSQLRFV